MEPISYLPSYKHQIISTTDELIFELKVVRNTRRSKITCLSDSKFFFIPIYNILYSGKYNEKKVSYRYLYYTTEIKVKI